MPSWSPTLSTLIERGQGVTLICNRPGCNELRGYGPAGHKDLEVEKTVVGLAVRFGGDQVTLEQVKRRAKCPKCGCGDVRVETW